MEIQIKCHVTVFRCSRTSLLKARVKSHFFAKLIRNTSPEKPHSVSQPNFRQVKLGRLNNKQSCLLKMGIVALRLGLSA